MSKAVSPFAQITDGQVRHLNELFGAALKKSSLNCGLLQEVIYRQSGQLVQELVSVVERFGQKLGKEVVVLAKTNRNRSPLQVILDTKRECYTEEDVVESMPGIKDGPGEDSVEVVFFQVESPGGHDEVAKECDRRGLKPVDPYLLASVHEENPMFADEMPNFTHWKNNQGKWCYIAFSTMKNPVNRCVLVSDGEILEGSKKKYAWFAGVRK